MDQELNVNCGIADFLDRVSMVPETAVQVPYSGRIVTWSQYEWGHCLRHLRPGAKLWRDGPRWFVSDWGFDSAPPPEKPHKPLAVTPRRSLVDRVFRRAWPPLLGRAS
jgi:hypothetical protein